MGKSFSIMKTSTDDSFSGGVRGIVELEVLRAIERALGGELPIQGFFDLIVGTRYVYNSTLSTI